MFFNMLTVLSDDIRQAMSVTNQGNHIFEPPSSCCLFENTKWPFRAFSTFIHHPRTEGIYFPPNEENSSEFITFRPSTVKNAFNSFETWLCVGITVLAIFKSSETKLNNFLET